VEPNGAAHTFCFLGDAELETAIAEAQGNLATARELVAVGGDDHIQYFEDELKALNAELAERAGRHVVSEIDQTFLASGIMNLTPESSIGAVENALRDLAAMLKGADDLRRASFREAALKKLDSIGINAPARLLDAALERSQVTAAADTSIFLADPEPWPEALAAAELADRIVEILKQFVVMSVHARRATALWILFAWGLDAFDIAALLAITSATKRSGKTTLLEIIGMLVPKPLAASNISPSAVFRAVEAFKPTLLIDEADTFLAGNDELRGILNAGHRRSSAFVVRTVKTDDEHEPKRFCTWGAKAIALIGKLPGTLEDRSIVVELRRRAPDERISRFRSRAVKELCDPLRRQACRWAADSIEALKKLEPDMPAGLNDRAADNWLPLLAIADHCGAKWPEHAREAAKVLSAAVDEAEDSAIVDLLRELKDLFESRDRISSADLAEHLGKQSEKRWADWRHGKPINERQIARLLAPLKIKPTSIRIGDKTPRGYLAEWFNDAFARYIPVFNRNSATSEEIQAFTKKIDPQQSGHVADDKTSLTDEKITNVADVADPWERGAA
jgi:putative DNA primase/helicase